MRYYADAACLTCRGIGGIKKEGQRYICDCIRKQFPSGTAGPFELWAEYDYLDDGTPIGIGLGYVPLKGGVDGWENEGGR